jgi:hypothetical protein
MDNANNRPAETASLADLQAADRAAAERTRKAHREMVAAADAMFAALETLAVRK